MVNKPLLDRKILERIIKDESYRDKINSEIDRAMDLIDAGHSGRSLIDQVSGGKNEKESIIELARSRISARGRFRSWNRLWMDSFSSRYATPESVSIHRAERISERKVVDLGSGAGIQAIFLQSHGGNEVTGIEVDYNRYLLSRINAIEMGVKGIKFLHGDFYTMNIDSLIKLGTVVYSDPLRSETAGPKSLQDLRPNPEIVYQKISPLTGNFCFDLPPHLPVDSISIKGELEYTSVDGLLSRLTLYTGDLQESSASAFLLPSGRKYSGNPSRLECHNDAPDNYLYMADQAMILSGLLYQVIQSDMYTVHCDARRTILSSHSFFEGFPGEIYHIIRETEMGDLTKNLSELGAGKVIPRYSIKPEGYYAFRNAIEKGLNGSMTLYLFNINDRFYLAEKMFPGET